MPHFPGFGFVGKTGFFYNNITPSGVKKIPSGMTLLLGINGNMNHCINNIPCVGIVELRQL